jgi:uncharacterized membrane protein YvbJ
MAIISCPSCGQRISDKAKTCSHCGYNQVIGVDSDGRTLEQLAQLEKLNHMKKRNRFQMLAMSGIIIFLLGTALWYFGGQGFETLADFIEISLIALGALLYLGARVALILIKKKPS